MERYHSNLELCVVGTGSAGNCYVINFEDKSLIIDAGMSVKKTLAFAQGKITAVIVSHFHIDHAKYVNDWIARGVKVVFNRSEKIDNIKIKPFELPHDTQNFGYYICFDEYNHYLAYITDTNEVNYTFSKLDTLMIEINYIDDIIERSFMSEKIDPKQYQRIINAHMSLNEAIKVIIKQDEVSKPKNIIVIHTSDRHSDEMEIIEKLRKITAANIYVAKPGMAINLQVF